MEQHEKGFQKVVQKVSFFAKDLDLGLFDPFKNVKDGVLLDEEDIVAEQEDVDEGRGVAEQGDDAYVQATFSLYFSSLLEFGRIYLLTMTIIFILFNALVFLR